MGLACLLMAPRFRPAARPKADERRRARWIAVSRPPPDRRLVRVHLRLSQWIPSSLAALLFCTFPDLGRAVFAHWLLPDEPLTARRTLPRRRWASRASPSSGSDAAEPSRATGAAAARRALRARLGHRLRHRQRAQQEAFCGVSPYQNVWGQTLVGAAFLAAGGVLRAGRADALDRSSILSLSHPRSLRTAMPSPDSSG